MISYEAAPKSLFESRNSANEIKEDSARTELGCSCEFMEEEDETMNVAAILRGVRNWRDVSHTKNMLARLSDRDLADIGLSRSDIDPGLTGDAERARRVDRYSRW